MKTGLSPLIIIGTHRSGTSLLAQILHRCGVFMGAWRNSHHESFFFLRRNHRIFRFAHADWDNPQPVKYLLTCQAIRSELTAILEKEMLSLEAVGYLGAANYLRSRGLRQIHHPWGWKDPRSTFTLPIWMDIFPGATVIHLCRNGVDVAHSLRQRELHRQDRLQNPLFSCRCTSMEGAFSLWAQYESMCLRVTNDLQEDRVLRLRFEDLLINPRQALHHVAALIPAGLDDSAIDGVVDGIKPERAYAFLKRDEARSYYEAKRHHPLMKELGYGDIAWPKT